MKLPSFLTLLMLTGCGACKSTPPAETAPKDLAEKGVVLDGPEDGATVRGRWISVSGWFDPAEIAFVSVVGAPVEEFYEPTGHVGVPSVTVTFRKDGRFFAPRVPVAEGSNRITVIALSRQMRPLGPIHRTVTATDVTSVPATVVAEPQQGKPGVAVRLRASIGTATERKWQWDFDGDGTFDEESAEASHAWPNPGRYQVRFEPGGGGAVIGNDKPTDPPSLSLPLYCWVVKGGFWEDGFSGMEDGTKWGGRRAVNHFHDPLATGGGGYTGLLDENALESTPMLNLVRRGISVTEWVMNAQSGGADGKNHWGYPTIGEGLHRAFSERELAKRESGLASAFRAMGQVMHLISDNTVPDHARDLAHPGDGFEEWLRDDARFKKLFGHTPAATWTIFPVRTLATDGIRAFWDRDVYSASPAATLSGLTPGIAEFTNANFLAWSHLKRGPADIDFSTVPKNTGEGFKRSPRLGSLAPTLAFLPLPRIDNLVEYPWPQLDSRDGNLFPSAPGSLPLPPVAVFDSAWSDGFSGPNVLGPEALESLRRAADGASARLRTERAFSGDAARAPASCTQAQLAIFPSGNGRMACNGWASGLGYFKLENTAQAPGLCAQVAPPLAVPRTVAYVHAFFEEPELFTEVFGLETLPMPPTFELTSL